MLTRRELIVLCAVFVMSLPALTKRLYASDEVQYFSWLRSVAFDRDVDFQNEYQHFYDAGVAASPGFHETFLERENEIHRRVNYATPGPALLWSPFYLIGHIVARVTGAPADGYSQPYISAIAYGSAFYGFAAVLLCVSIARRTLGHGLLASLIVAAGTPLIFYCYVAPGFGHAASAFAVSLFVWVWIRARRRWSIGGAIALGLSGGLMGIVREQDVALVIGPVIDFLVFATGARAAHRRRDMTAAAGAGALAFLAGIAPLLLAYRALNGKFFATETAARKMNWASPHAWSVLFDSEHGLFAWTPLALLAVTGLLLLWILGPGARARGQSRATDDGDLRWLAALAFVMVLAQAYTSGAVESWTVAGSFGQRRFVAVTPLLVLGVSALLVRLRGGWAQRTVTAAIVLSVWWNLGLMAQFGLNRMDRQKLNLVENARITFLELPVEAPALAWRYLTDRSSFYKK